MLSRPEIGTREHIKLWLAGQDPNVQVQWKNAKECVTAVYAGELYGDRSRRTETSDLCELDSIVRDLASIGGGKCRPVSFGEIYAAVLAAWN